MKKDIKINESNQKRLLPSFSVPNYTENNKFSFRDNNIKLNFNYEKNKQDDNNIKYKKNEYLKNTKLNQNEYKNYLFEKDDKYEELVIKNRNLKRLFEQVNHKLLISLKKQQEIESKYENEKKEIIEKLSRIQENYEIYANSHQKLNIFGDKIDEISNTYNQLLELYSKTNEKLKVYKNNIFQIYKNITDFIENNYDNNLINILSFEFLLHLRNEMNNQFKFNDSFLNKNSYTQRNNHKEILNSKTAKYYIKNQYSNAFDFSQSKKKVNNIFNNNTNIYLIDKTKINNQSNSKYIDNTISKKQFNKIKDKEK